LYDDGFSKKEPPNTATSDATRKHEIEFADYQQEVEVLRKLRVATEGYLSIAAYEQLHVRTVCLQKKSSVE
jgi:hypothetical protein